MRLIKKYPFKRKIVTVITLYAALLFGAPFVFAQANPRTIPIAKGWAKNQINAVIFRKNSLVTHRNIQYAAFYDEESRVVLAKRKLGSENWTIKTTTLTGNTRDAHNSISIAADGDGFLHIAWDHHNTGLKYSRGNAPGSLELAPPQAMIGSKETRVSYPEFYALPGGDLLFAYRDGASGSGDLVLNRYSVKVKKWTRLQENLIDGEGKRNAYWQMTTDEKGRVHLSWVWRESPNVASNHDLCYARSTDGGKTWTKSSGEKYSLPVTAETAEYIWRIPQNSELINQTSMAADSLGRPYIASYWKPQGTEVPQYHVIYFDSRQWKLSQVTRRVTPFSLSGAGTKRIPISRPQILVRSKEQQPEVVVIFRDSERGDRVSAAVTEDITKGVWAIRDLSKERVGMWEPTLDPVVWATKKQIHLFVQNVGQGDGEGLEDLPAQMISVLEWKP